MIPNLLSAALTLIPSVSFKYYKFKANTVNERGLDVSEYELPVTVRGLVAPVPADKYEELDLSLQKEHIYVHAPINILSLRVQESPDKVEYNGNFYFIIRIVDWFNYNGWTSCIAARTE